MTNQLQMPIDLYKNKNSKSTSFGRWYCKVANREPLSNEGLVDHIMHHNCAVGREAIAAVIKKLGDCIPELVAQGQPVKIDGLGIFYATATTPEGIQNIQPSDVNPLSYLNGIRFRFKPESTNLNDLTSKSFLRSKVTPFIQYVTNTYEITKDGKKISGTRRATLQEYRNDPTVIDAPTVNP